MGISEYYKMDSNMLFPSFFALFHYFISTKSGSSSKRVKCTYWRVIADAADFAVSCHGLQVGLGGGAGTHVGVDTTVTCIVIN